MPKKKLATGNPEPKVKKEKKVAEKKSVKPIEKKPATKKPKTVIGSVKSEVVKATAPRSAKSETPKVTKSSEPKAPVIEKPAAKQIKPVIPAKAGIQSSLDPGVRRGDVSLQTSKVEAPVKSKPVSTVPTATRMLWLEREPGWSQGRARHLGVLREGQRNR
jgi:hypothetical protein